MRVAPLLLALVLAGCALPHRTVHQVGVFNGFTEPVTVAVNALDPATGEAVFSHTFENVMPMNGSQVEHRFPNGVPHFFEAWMPVGEKTANGSFTMHSGSWYVTAHVDRAGLLTLNVLHGD